MAKIWVAEVRDTEVIALCYSHRGAVDAVEAWLVREESVPEVQQKIGAENNWRSCGIEGGLCLTYRTRRGHQHDAYVYPMVVTS